MGLSPSKPRPRPYPLVNPGFNVPFGQNPNLYLPPQLQTQTSRPNEKKKRRGSEQEKLAEAYVQGWQAGHNGMGPQQSIQPAAQQRQPENIPPAATRAPAAPVRATPLFTPRAGVQLRSFASPRAPPTIATQRTHTPFTTNTFGEPETQAVPSAAQQFSQPQQPEQERANPTLAQVLQPLPPPIPAVYGPQPPQGPLPPLANPLPTPPRDLYELSPYNTLLNLPQTTALLTSNYAQMGGVPAPRYERRRGGRSGGLLRALTGRGRKEEDIHFVPVFINPPISGNTVSQQQPAVNLGAPAAAAAASGPAPVAFDPMPVPPTPADLQNYAQTQQPIRFSGSTPQYAAFLNYSPHRIIYNDKDYPTAMHMHEAMKFLPANPALAERIRMCPDVTEVYSISADLERLFPDAVRSDWPVEYINLMEEAVLLKFRQHANLRDMLLKTLDAPLIYADEQDIYWGQGPPGSGGENHLGKLLERVRAQLAAEGGLHI
ncbi:hypothetical protein GGX14DRAFT_694201 [Mycena pura]|uniref:NADAR domain-containing protein n=1 Tax=Mycena pura TaxID=153505 RepID=A0AAD6YNG0_9AGAR|nr:hypothetical protein GGX14DRAFT_694201 [Mycena pura]